MNVMCLLTPDDLNTHSLIVPCKKQKDSRLIMVNLVYILGKNILHGPIILVHQAYYSWFECEFMIKIIR